MSNPLSTIENRRINPLWGIVLIAGTPVLILMVGILSMEASFGWGVATPDKDGNIVYANHVSFKGWEAVPFQAIAGLIGSGATAYGAYKLSTKKESLPPPASPPPEEQ